MSRRGKEPRLLAQVLQAVADLKEMRGSTARRIVDQVQTAINISNLRPKPRNVITQVRRALKHGVQTGVLRQRSGKFRLATANEINQVINQACGPCKRKQRSRAGKRRKKTGRSRTRRRQRVDIRRRTEHLPDPTIVPTPNMKTQPSDGHLEQHVDGSNNHHRSYYTTSARRRDRRKPARGKKRRKRRISHQTDNIPIIPNTELSSVNNNNTRDIANKKRPRNRGNADFERQDYNNSGGHTQHANQREANGQNRPECDNPECLCNLKKETEDRPPDSGGYDGGRNNNTYSH